MLCTLCQHGVTTKIDGKPTGATWDCVCGESNCRHIKLCECGRLKGYRYKLGDKFELTRNQYDNDEGRERETAAGNIVEIIGLVEDNPDNPYMIGCPATGGSWFFSESELATDAKPI